MKNIWLWAIGILSIVFIASYLRSPLKSLVQKTPTLEKMGNGTLAFGITDPGKADLPPQAKDQDRGSNSKSDKNSKSGGPQTVTALNLTITKVEVHQAAGQEMEPSPMSKEAELTVTPTIFPEGKLTDTWKSLNIPTSTVDLVKLANNNNIDVLGITTLPAGKYTQIRLFLSAASATLSNGQRVNLDILGQDKEVKVIQPFTILVNKTTTLVMHFDAQRSIIKADGKYILKPVVARLIEQ